MQILIPMAGQGKRFQKAGYTVPKPLIEIDNKPMIAHVIDLFPGETDFIFYCRQSHLENSEFQMAKTLGHWCPTGQIISMPDEHPHHGPIGALTADLDRINDSQPVVINYCDFACYWQWEDFKKMVRETGCDGAIPAYRGFHPHSLGSTYYAYLKNDGKKVLDIQEKKPWTLNPMDEFASSGTYYFKTGALLKEAIGEMIKQNLKVNNEYYASLAYKPMLKANKDIRVWPLQHFMQWGTPKDLEDYQEVSKAFTALTEPRKKAQHDGSVCIPMAGFGSRFKVAGFQTPKPLLPVSGKPMVMQALSDLPKAPCQRLILREEAKDIQQWVSQVDTLTLDSPTQGQASTVLAGLEGLDLAKPVTIGCCDNGALYSADVFQKLMKKEQVDIIVWSVRGHVPARRHPTQYGWIDAEGGIIDKISVKVPLKNPSIDPIVTGTFTFKRAGDCKAAIERMIARKARVNGEYYLDMAINDAIALGLRCALFEVDHYFGWGTPDEWRIFKYWQSCFHQWPAHPYRLSDDQHVAQQDEHNTAMNVIRWEESLVD